jgi:acyl carrier protein
MISQNSKFIEEQLKDMIVQAFGIDRSKLSHHSKVKELGRDSLAVLELLAAVEAQFEISIPDEEVPRLSSFGSLVDSIERHLKIKPDSA